MKDAEPCLVEGIWPTSILWLELFAPNLNMCEVLTKSTACKSLMGRFAALHGCGRPSLACHKIYASPRFYAPIKFSSKSLPVPLKLCGNYVKRFWTFFETLDDETRASKLGGRKGSRVVATVCPGKVCQDEQRWVVYYPPTCIMNCIQRTNIDSSTTN